MKIGRIACFSTALLTLSCAESDGPVSVDAQYNLTCPVGSEVGCGPRDPDTCLGPVGQRSIVGARGDVACTGDVLDVKCQAVDGSDGRTFISLEAYVGNQFAFMLDAVLGDDSVDDDEPCEVTIIEDGADYGGPVTGACGTEPPSFDQACQITNLSTAGGSVTFDLECRALFSSTSVLGFDVGAVGGGPATFSFSNCSGF